MAQLWQLVLSLFIGILSIICLIFVKKWRKHIIIKDLKWNKFKLFRCSNIFSDLIDFQFPNDSSNLVNLKSFKGNLFIEIIGFSCKFSNFKLILNIDLINISLNSSLFKPKAQNTAKTSIFHKLLTRFTIGTLRIIQLNCRSCSFALFVENTSDSNSLICELFTIKDLTISKSSSNVFEFRSVKLNQILVGAESFSKESIFSAGTLKLNRNCNTDRFDLNFDELIALNVNVRLLFFVSSFIKSVSAENDSLESEPYLSASTIPWPFLLNIKIPLIDFKLILPETDPTVKYFKWLQLKISTIDIKCFVPMNGLPILTCWLDKFEISAKIDDEKNIGLKHFCPLDKFLSRGPSNISGQTRELIISKNIFLTNWTLSKNAQITSLPKNLIVKWISSILLNSPICSIKQDKHLDFGSMDLNMTEMEEFKDRKNSIRKLNLEFFRNKKLKSNPAVFGFLDQLDFNIPFEFPISSLIDHSVVLFKAGWRPLSKKTDAGYWIGDGDKFLKSDWAVNLEVKNAKIRVEDDSFETKISAISHFQRKLAESRSRLEPEVLSEFSNEVYESSNEVTTQDVRNLADLLSTTSEPLNSNQSLAIIELNKSLFTEYRDYIGKSHLLTNWSLVDLSIDDLKVSLSWSPEYLGRDGSLSALLNNIENGNQIDSKTIDTLSTFLGGFVDISGSAVQVNLRNYSRPVLIAPDLRVIGPVFLVEDGVKDPDVLIKFPVRVLPENLFSSFLNLPNDGIVEVLRSIVPLKMYHCVHMTISKPDLVQASVSPYWLGCIALLDRVIDRFVKASTEDPSAPLPGWDKLRYNVHGCHSRLTISSPCIISRIIDSDPLSCSEVLNLSFPHGVDIGIIPGGIFVLKCPESTLSVDSQYLYRVRAAIESSGSIHLWDLKLENETNGIEIKNRNFSTSSLDLSQNNMIPIIDLSETHLELKFNIKNIFNEDPCHHWSIRPIARSNSSKDHEWVNNILV